MSEDQYSYKIVIIGNSAVGKTSILSTICDSTFKQAFIATLGVDLKNYNIQIGGSNIKLSMWDTAGQQRFKTITRNYYRDADGIIFAYSITDPQSFKQIESWIRQVQQFAPENVVRMLVGNKIDLEEKREVKHLEGKVLASTYSVGFREVSAKTGENLQEMIRELAGEVHSRFRNREMRKSNRIEKGKEEAQQSRSCC